MPAGSFALDLNKKEHPATPGARQKKRNKNQKQRKTSKTVLLKQMHRL